MNVRAVTGTGAPTSVLPFSPTAKAGQLVFVSGQASVNADGAIVSDSFEGEMRRSMGNLKAVLAGAGLGLADLVQVRGYVAKEEFLAEYNRIYREYFSDPLPARTTLIGCLGNLLKFEIDAVAWAAESKAG